MELAEIFSSPKETFLQPKEHEHISQSELKCLVSGTEPLQAVPYRKCSYSGTALEGGCENCINDIHPPSGPSTWATALQDNLSCAGYDCVRYPKIWPPLAKGEEIPLANSQSTNNEVSTPTTEEHKVTKLCSHHVETPRDISTTFDYNQIGMTQASDSSSFTESNDVSPTTTVHSLQTPLTEKSPPFTTGSSTYVSPTSSVESGSWGDYTVSSGPQFNTKSNGDYPFCCPDKISGSCWHIKDSDEISALGPTFDQMSAFGVTPKPPTIYTDFSAFDFGQPKSQSGSTSHSPNCNGNTIENAPAHIPVVSTDIGNLTGPELYIGELDSEHHTSLSPTSATSFMGSTEFVSRNNTVDKIPISSEKSCHCGFKPSGKAESFGAYLRKHLKKHTPRESRELPCKICKSTFTRRDNLTAHNNKVHSISNDADKDVTTKKRRSEAGPGGEALESKRSRRKQRQKQQKQLEVPGTLRE